MASPRALSPCSESERAYRATCTLPPMPEECPECKAKVQLCHGQNETNDGMFVCPNTKCKWPFTSAEEFEAFSGFSDAKLYNKWQEELKKKESRNKVAPSVKRASILPIDQLEALRGDPDSGIFRIRQKMSPALHPRCLNDLSLGLVNHFNELIGHYHPDLEGILAGYGKITLRSPHGHFLNEGAHIHLDVEADFWVFRPSVGAVLQGVVKEIDTSHVSVLVHGCFDVTCPLPAGIQSTEWSGAKSRIGQIVHFMMTKTDLSQEIPYIEVLGTDDEVSHELPTSVSPQKEENNNLGTSEEAEKNPSTNMKKDGTPEEPRKVSPYALFYQDVRKNLNSKFQDMNSDDKAKILAHMWQFLSQEERDNYIMKAKIENTISDL